MVETNFKQTDIGLIPEDWEVKEIRDALTIKHGKSQKEVIDKNGIYPIYGTGGIMGYAKEYLYNKPSVLIGRKGTIDKPRYLDKPFWTVDTLFYSEVSEIQNAKYLFYIFDLIKWYQYNEASGVPSLNAKTIEDIQVPLPPLSEQQAIAEALSDIDAWIESLEKLIAKKCLLKQGTMQQLFTPKEGWERKKIGEICIITRGASPRPIDSPIWFDDKSNIGWVRISDVTKSNKFLNSTTQSLSEVGVKNSRYVKSESLIMSICATIGKPIITKIDVCIHDGFVVFTNLQIDQNYLYNFLKNIEKEWAKNGQTGSQMNLNTTLINTTEIIFPKSRLEQTQIASILSDMDSEIQTLEQKLNKARQIKQGMMQELLTGRIRLINSATIDNVKETPKGHNEHFNDAVLIGTMASCFGSAKFPMTRFKYTKVSYLLKRYKEEQDAGYLKKAAGPYKPQTRYGGAEKIALKNKYVEPQEINYKGKTSEGFIASDSVNEALKYFNDWYGVDALKWIKQFKFETNDNLELWATVDMAIEDLKREGKSINVESIKQVIKDNKEWREKLKRPIFSDINIQQAITKLYTLFT